MLIILPQPGIGLPLNILYARKHAIVSFYFPIKTL